MDLLGSKMSNYLFSASKTVPYLDPLIPKRSVHMIGSFRSIKVHLFGPQVGANSSIYYKSLGNLETKENLLGELGDLFNQKSEKN